jgi:ferrous iron transport protein B
VTTNGIQDQGTLDQATLDQDPSINHTARVALVGRPNVGKTSLFNRLTGLKLKTANYNGVTVEHAEGTLAGPEGEVTLLDLPGACSLSPFSPDEALMTDTLIFGRLGAIDAIISVVDATHLVEGLYLTLQTIELGLPVILAVNQVDVAQAQGLSLNLDALADRLDVRVVGLSAKTGEGISELINALSQLGDRPQPTQRERGRRERTHAPWYLPLIPSPHFETLDERLSVGTHPLDTISLDARRQWALNTAALVETPLSAEMKAMALRALEKQPELKVACEQTIQGRFQWLDRHANVWVTLPPEGTGRHLWTARLDRWALHPLVGSVLFLGVMLFMFQLLFAWADPIITLIESGVAGLSDLALSLLPPHLLRDLLVEGLINGVGNVIVFLPQVVLLFTLIGLMEDSGYMARVAALMDRVMRALGLSGMAFVPLFSGYVCAVPAILATRTLPQRRDRLLTMMALPLVTCSARLPVYILLISVLVPTDATWMAVSLRAWVMIGLYGFATITALIAIGVMGRTILKGAPPPLLLELPDYKRPTFGDLRRRVVSRSMIFVREAGTVILVGTVILWALLSFPRLESPPSMTNNATEGSEVITGDAIFIEPLSQIALQRERSWGGQIGKLMEPALRPLGWDWQVGIGILGAFAAREVFVSTLGVVYGVGGEVDEETPQLRQKLKEARHADGSPVFTPLSALSLLIFFALACQCLSTLAVVQRETGGYFWPLFLLGYMSALAYGCAWVTYQGGLSLGFT